MMIDWTAYGEFSDSGWGWRAAKRNSPCYACGRPVFTTTVRIYDRVQGTDETGRVRPYPDDIRLCDTCLGRVSEFIESIRKEEGQ